MSEGWGRERIGAVVFVAALPIALCVVIVAVYCCRCKPFVARREGYFWTIAIVQAVAFGFLFAFWAHFVPCVWLTCDLGEGDNGTLRGLIWFVGWPVIVLALVAPCVFGRDYGMVVRSKRFSGLPQLDT
jgi:hypothetical protein